MAAAVLLMDGRGRGRRAKLVLAGCAAVPPPRPRWRWPVAELRARGEWLCGAGALTAAALAESVVPLLVGALAVPLVRRARRTRERERARARRAEEVISLCGSLAAELRAGLQPGQALAAVGAGQALGAAEPAVLAAVRFGGDVPRALRDAATEPGAEGLSGVAACWSVAVGSGAGLAAGLDRLEAALRAEHDQREDLDAQLAGARSTIVLLAFLPLVALGLGSALGADPLRVLLHTPAGLLCLLAGAVLEAAGLWWAARIVHRGRFR
ncbi:type II secretion system F family protein [Streptomyces tsukubensis]|uniref:type II secretion system F family protein n=1 Tax=Streptomyces tsukubensis TaxID=83656 RepID=UPI00344C4F15